MSKEARLQQLTTELQQAAKAYYTENREIMSNKEYDQKYDELVALEQELGTSLPDRLILSDIRLFHIWKKLPMKSRLYLWIKPKTENRLSHG